MILWAPRTSLLYAMAVWWEGPVSVVGAAREGMEGAGDGFQPRLQPGVWTA